MYFIGQTLNASDTRVAEAMATGERRWLEGVARRQADAGMDAIDVQAGSFADDEAIILRAILPWIEASSATRICIDSAQLPLLLELAAERHRPPVLNSLGLEQEWPAQLRELSDRGATLILQLRDGSSVPRDYDERVRWTEEVDRRLRSLGISWERVFLDPVLLPWGEDLSRGAGLFQFLREAPGLWPGLRSLIGLSNVSHGHPNRGELHHLWFRELCAAGLAAAIVDPFDAPLLRIAS